MTVLRETTISLPDACRRLGKTYGAVYRWLKKPGKSGRPLEAQKVGGTWYTSLEALERYSHSIDTQSNNGTHADAESRRVLETQFGFGRRKLTKG